MSSSQISSSDLRRQDENSPNECERTEGRHVAVTASCPRLLSPPVYVTEETAVNELNGRTTDVRDSTSAGVFPRPESEGTAVDAVHSPSGNEATAGEEAPSDPTIDRMINGQNQPAIKASTTVTEAPPSDGHDHNGQLDPTVDLEINGGDHVAIKAPQPFSIADASAETLLTSSTSDTADDGIARNPAPSRAEPRSVGTVQARPVRASGKVARAEPAQVAPSEAALAQAMPAQPSEAAPAQDVPAQAQVAQAEPEQPAQAAPVQALAQVKGKSLRPKKKIGRQLLHPPSVTSSKPTPSQQIELVLPLLIGALRLSQTKPLEPTRIPTLVETSILAPNTSLGHTISTLSGLNSTMPHRSNPTMPTGHLSWAQ
ncbi:unnamed protein product [Spirodela intermedia]|uniref:Uncharacterized protein n=1 Tax=Spirodela intermedia TaxID=51605 RepID=A0A7I8IWQ8_SPIIN|nr:unnamed protein product [Spirodela intermedia]CAA6662426.1 unnamed protein product [Spirodela intermedia]